MVLAERREERTMLRMRLADDTRRCLWRGIRGCVVGDRGGGSDIIATIIVARYLGLELWDLKNSELKDQGG